MSLHGKLSKYFFVVSFLVIIVLSVYTVLPFLSPIVFAALVAYIFYPLYQALNRRIKSKTLNAFIVSIFIILLFTAPVFFLIKTLTTEVNTLYIAAKMKLQGGAIGADIVVQCSGDNGFVCNLVRNVNVMIRDPQVKEYLNTFFASTLGFITQVTSDIILGVPRIILSILISILATFYFLRDGADLIKRLRKSVPLKLHHQDELFTQLDNVIYAVVYGALIIAVVQGSLGAIGFFFAGIKSPVFWGGIMSIFALIPFIGTAPIWGTAAVILLAIGLTQGDTAMIWRGAGLALYGALVISTVDNFMRPWLIGERARVHPLIILLGVFGGLATFGVIGFILGPIILAMGKTMYEIYETEEIPHRKRKKR